MNPERIVKKRKAAAKKGPTVVEKVPRKSYILRKRRVLASLWVHVDEVEKRVPKSLAEAVEISRQSRRWRKRLARFTKLKAVAIPSHALLVDCWGKELLLGAGTRKKMEALIDGSEAIRNAGYKLICLSNLAEEKQKVDEMKFVQGKEDADHE